MGLHSFWRKGGLEFRITTNLESRHKTPLYSSSSFHEDKDNGRQENENDMEKE